MDALIFFAAVSVLVVWCFWWWVIVGLFGCFKGSVILLLWYLFVVLVHMVFNKKFLVCMCSSNRAIDHFILRVSSFDSLLVGQCFLAGSVS